MSFWQEPLCVLLQNSRPDKAPAWVVWKRIPLSSRMNSFSPSSPLLAILSRYVCTDTL